MKRPPASVLAVVVAVALLDSAAGAWRLLSGSSQGWALLEILPALALEAALATAAAALVVGLVWLLSQRTGVAALAGVVLLIGLLAAGAGEGPAKRTATGTASQGTERPSSTATERAATAPTRTILLLTADTLRRDHVSASVDALIPGLTPRIDGLAADGILFEDAVTSAPLTLPSHTSMLSGLSPDRHGAVRNGRLVPRDLDSAPAALGRAGYATAAFVSTSVLHGGHGLAAWFDVYRDELGARPGARWLPLARLLPGSAPPVRRLAKEPGNLTVDRALSWLARQPAEQPVFLWVHLYDAHTPHGEHPGEAGRGAPPAVLPDPCSFDVHPSSARRGMRSMDLLAGRRGRAACGSTAQERVATLAAGYAAEVRFLDTQVGRLLDGLDAQGRGDGAAILFAADHGESLGEHNHRGAHEYSLYDPVLRVPLIVRPPVGEGGAALHGGRVEPQVSTVSVAATLTRFGGVEAPPGAASPDLLAVALGEARPPSSVVAVGPSPWDRVDGNHPGRRGTGLQVAVRSAGRKTLADGGGYVERYDLAVDPQERVSLIGQPEVTAVHAARAEALRRASLALPLLPGLAGPPGLGGGPAGRRSGMDRRPGGRPGGAGHSVALEAPLELAPPHFATEDLLANQVLAEWARGGTSLERSALGDDPNAELPREVLDVLQSLGYVQ